MTTANTKKKQKLRNNEYYDMQEVYDGLYAKSKDGQIFKNLLPIILDEQNIMLAYRSIKKNKGSNTKGVNETTIIDIGKSDPNKLVEYVRFRLKDFHPHKVRRVEIPKPDGRKRPLGIASIEDRLIQQCIKQVLEPICEAKFHPHSYGFRPNRSAQHAIARSMYLINQANFHYVVDIDIKSFFDNVNHSKLLKQMWTLGIRDKNLLCIISKMLKAEIKGIGIPEKGTPQGGILSPLLSGIVLNELDWWISDQWESFQTNHSYTQWNKYRAMQTTNLKEIFIVRYADDFKIFCKNMDTACNIFAATQQWLRERLQLEISPEKSKIVNLKKNYSEFLGFRLKVHRKGKKWVVKSHMNEKALKKCKEKLKEKIREIPKEPTACTASKLNLVILGMHNYYQYATNVNLDFRKIAFSVSKTLYNRTKGIKGKTGVKSNAFVKYYGRYKYKIIYIDNVALFPIAGITTKHPLNFTQEVNNYTAEGRQIIHERLKKIDLFILKHLMANPVQSESVEYNDNRISLYVGQSGKCKVTRIPLQLESMEVHRITPRSKGGTDKYDNLIFVSCTIHKLIHATDTHAIEEYLQTNRLDAKMLKRLNKFRVQIGNCEI